jgi:rare lipoprotein A
MENGRTMRRCGPLVVAAMLALAACQTAVVPPPPPPPPAPEPEPPPLDCPQTSQYREEGVASWYGRTHHGKKTASGVPFDMHALTAAHRRLPLGTQVRVTNLANRRAVELLINDRGPYIRGRILDTSMRAAQELDFIERGTTRVRIETLTPGC